MQLNIQLLEHKIKQELKDSDIYTVFNLYIGMIELCKKENTKKSTCLNRAIGN